MQKKQGIKYRKVTQYPGERFWKVLRVPRFNNFHPGDHGASVVHDRLVTAGAVDFLSKRQPGRKPFFLFTGYLASHFLSSCRSNTGTAIAQRWMRR